MEIRKTGNVDKKWVKIAKETIERTLDFMGCADPPILHIFEGYLALSSPYGQYNIGAGYNHKTKETMVSIQWLIEKAARLRSIPKHDTLEELMHFTIAHEVCHYVQDIKGHLPPPDESIDWLVTDINHYDNLPHEREANIVGMEMSLGVIVPATPLAFIFQYKKRDPQLRGTGF